MPEKRSRRRVLALTGSALAVTLGGCAGVTGRGSDGTDRATNTTTTTSAARTSEQTETRTRTTETRATETAEPIEIEPASGPLANAPASDAPKEHRYAVMGSADTTATLYGSWKCPYTEDFVSDQLPRIVTEYVEPGDLQVEFRGLAYYDDEPFLGPDAPRVTRAGLSVWNADPQSYWRYFASVFANQPDESRQWATTDLLLRFAASAGVGDRPRVKREIDGGAYDDAVRATTKAATEREITSVPRIAVDGTVTAPTVDPEATREQLEAAIRS